jgi:hypothetical protein
MMTRKPLIQELVRAGHSAEKALQIAIDVERGDGRAKLWIFVLRLGAA